MILDLSDRCELDYGLLGGENHIFCCASGTIQGMIFFPAPQVGNAHVNITTVMHRAKGWMGPAMKYKNLLN